MTVCRRPDPSPPTERPETGDAWRSGRFLVVRRVAHLPPRCVHCNAPVDGKMKRKDVYWHHPAIFLSILAGLLIYVILALVLRKTVRVHYVLCRSHRNRRLRHILVAWLLVLLCPALVVLAVQLDHGAPALLGVVMLFAGLIYAVIFVPVLTPKKIDEHFGWLKRAHPDFLATLPETL